MPGARIWTASEEKSLKSNVDEQLCHDPLKSVLSPIWCISSGTSTSASATIIFPSRHDGDVVRNHTLTIHTPTASIDPAMEIGPSRDLLKMVSVDAFGRFLTVACVAGAKQSWSMPSAF